MHSSLQLLLWLSCFTPPNASLLHSNKTFGIGLEATRVYHRSVKLLPALLLAVVLSLGVACASEPAPIRIAKSEIAVHQPQRLGLRPLWQLVVHLPVGLAPEVSATRELAAVPDDLPQS